MAKTSRQLTKAAISALSFEEAYERLNDTAARLERGNLSLEESLALYEAGVLLSQQCEALLDGAELRVSQVTPGNSSLPTDEADNDEIFEDEDDEF